jgi:hypothetical protein
VCNVKSRQHKPEMENMRTELLYWTIIRILCDLCFDNFCMIFAKLIVAKKFLHEKSVRRSISSSCFCPFGRIVVFTTACRGGLSMLSSGRMAGGLCEKCSWQNWKKLEQGRVSAEEAPPRGYVDLTCFLGRRPSKLQKQKLPVDQTS